jgi:hypothetical protein
LKNAVVIDGVDTGSGEAPAAAKSENVGACGDGD